ncbi:MAG TPA: hypothetical protein HA292_02065 [Candidatus Nitrosotenuis sp.]|jgi:dihydroorotase-like cyclic amidohydrolase|nr:hypothetical protein [Candidatus Nitrosotenuis sp.]HIH68459.1 hypothetical protein [Candidatus Nitrosotenuis sp.]HII03888.1 hypothetical protein [Candidatus Nitrosotenuis sp.]
MTEEQEWASLLSEVFDRLTTKHAAITYEFKDLVVAGEKKGPSGPIPTGKVTLNGKLTISTSK